MGSDTLPNGQTKRDASSERKASRPNDISVTDQDSLAPVEALAPISLEMVWHRAEAGSKVARAFATRAAVAYPARLVDEIASSLGPDGPTGLAQSVSNEAIKLGRIARGITRGRFGKTAELRVREVDGADGEKGMAGAQIRIEIMTAFADAQTPEQIEALANWAVEEFELAMCPALGPGRVLGVSWCPEGKTHEIPRGLAGLCHWGGDPQKPAQASTKAWKAERKGWLALGMAAQAARPADAAPAPSEQVLEVAKPRGARP